MLHAFEVYCVRQGSAALLLNHLEKEKELLRIFLRVSQMENTLLRRMNLRSFLVVPVQRVTKYETMFTYKHIKTHTIIMLTLYWLYISLYLFISHIILLMPVLLPIDTHYYWIASTKSHHIITETEKLWKNLNRRLNYISNI